MLLEPGDLFEDYRIIRPFGDPGGMGSVYLAEQSNTSRIVILKVSRTRLDPAAAAKNPDEYRRNAKLIARFKREMDILVALRHDNIVRLIDGGIRNGVAWMALQYIDGESLEQRLQRPVDTADGLALFRQVAAALDHAHGKGVVHCDLKPSNILLSRTGNAYLADFGISKLVEGDPTKLTTTGNVVGSCEYMSPEQATGISQTKSVDIYALTIVCYRWLLKKVPFAFKGNPMEVLVRHVKDDLPAEDLAGLRPEVAQVLRGGARKDPEARYSSATALIDDLARALRGEPIRGAGAKPSGATATRAIDAVRAPTRQPPQAERTSSRRVERRWPPFRAILIGLTIALPPGYVAYVLLPVDPRDSPSPPPIAGNRNPAEPAAARSSNSVVTRMPPLQPQTPATSVPNDRVAHSPASAATRQPAEEAALAYQEALRLTDRLGDKQATEKMVAQLRKAADLGSARAQFALGLVYDLGERVAADPVQAIAWYRKAADQGYAKAQNNLGNAYRTGSGVDADAAAAMRWYRKAADANNASAQFNLGAMLFFEGQGVDTDKPEAVGWFQKSADQGNPRAQFELSIAYSNGLGIARDPEKSASWKKKAAEQGYEPSANFGSNLQANDVELDLHLSLRAAPMIER